MKREKKIVLFMVLVFFMVTALSYTVTGSNRLNSKIIAMNNNISDFNLELEKLEYLVSTMEIENILLKEKNIELEEKNVLLEEKVQILEEQSDILSGKIDVSVQKKQEEKLEQEKTLKLENLNVPLNLDLKKHIILVAKKHNIDPYIFYGIISVESSFNPYTIGYNKNGTYDSGLCQINSSNTRWLRSQGFNIDNVYGNIEAGAHILKINLEKTGWNYERALTGYNTGSVNYVNSYAKKVLNKADIYRTQ